MNKIYAIYRNRDMEEGRGPMLFEVAFSNKEAAIDYINIKCQSSMVPSGMTPWEYIESGKDGGWLMHEIRELVFFDSARDAIDAENESVRQQALMKLTDAERRALGV